MRRNYGTFYQLNAAPQNLWHPSNPGELFRPKNVPSIFKSSSKPPSSNVSSKSDCHFNAFLFSHFASFISIFSLFVVGDRRQVRKLNKKRKMCMLWVLAVRLAWLDVCLCQTHIYIGICHFLCPKTTPVERRAGKLSSFPSAFKLCVCV